MTPEQVKQLLNLHPTFYADCDRISNKLIPLNEDFKDVTEFGIEETGKNVVCFGQVLPWGQSHVYPVLVEFPVELLYATDEEIDEYIRNNKK